MNNKTSPIRPAARYIPSTLDPRDFPSPLKHGPSSEKKLKFIVSLQPLQSNTFKTLKDEELENQRVETEPSNHPSFFLGKPIRLSKCTKNNLGFYSMDYASYKRNKIEEAEADDSEEFRKGLITPFRAERLISGDESPHNILGEDVVSNFYQHYKKLDKVRDINSFTQVQDATYTSFLGKTESLQLLPSKIGFIRDKGEADKIKLK